MLPPTLNKIRLKLKKILLISSIQNFLRVPKNLIAIRGQLDELHDLLLSAHIKQQQATQLNPLNKFGKKCYSQSDEDGITLEILKRLNLIEKGVFAEFGVSDGTENNTLVLAALGWKGFWVGGEDLAFNADINKRRFSYIKEWITLDNIVSLAQKGLSDIGEKRVDLMALDLDGNDYYFVEGLLKSGLHPKVFVVEYNAKFPPPIKFKIKYNDKHIWSGDDYFGASLSSFTELFGQYGYTLICCNAHTGANAFFIQNSYLHLFEDVPKDIGDIFMEPKYYVYKNFGHKQSLNTIINIFDSH